MVGSDKIRVDNEFKKAIQKIQIERVKNGSDKKMKTSARITKGFTRLDEFDIMVKKAIGGVFKDE